MKIYYSPETKGFYSDEMHGDQVPKDAFEITEEKHKELLENQGKGLQIHYDKKTKELKNVDPKTLWTVDDWWDFLKSRRDSLLRDSDTYVLPDRWARMTPDMQTAWSDYRQALRDLPTKTKDPKKVVWPTKPE